MSVMKMGSASGGDQSSSVTSNNQEDSLGKDDRWVVIDSKMTLAYDDEPVQRTGSPIGNLSRCCQISCL